MPADTISSRVRSPCYNFGFRAWVLDLVGACPLFLFRDLKPAQMQDVIGQLRAIASRVAGSHGFDIFDVQYRREGPGMVLRVQIDRPWNARSDEHAAPLAMAEEGVSVEDCANVSRDLSAVLDVEDIVPAAYILEVSSPGLDRPLRQAVDYRRFAGRRAKIVMREAIEGQMFFKGRLGGTETDARDGAVVLITTDDGRTHRVPVGVITRANLEVEF
jgi:ribosome maturation factor RimP